MYMNGYGGLTRIHDHLHSHDNACQCSTDKDKTIQATDTIQQGYTYMTGMLYVTKHAWKRACQKMQMTGTWNSKNIPMKISTLLVF